MILKKIQTALEADTFTTTFAPADEQVPLDRLLVLLPNEIDHEIALELLLIPGMSEELEHSLLLQHFVILPCEATPETISELRAFLLHINITLPLPSFGVNEADGFIYYKYVSVISDGEPETYMKQVVEAVWLIDYFVELFFAIIEAVGQGKLTAEQAIAQVTGAAENPE